MANEGEGPGSSREGVDRPAAAGDREEHIGEQQFRAFVDAVEEYALFRLDPEGHVVSWNTGAEEIKGYARGEIVGEHFSTFYTEADRSAGVPEKNLVAAATRGSVEDEGWRVRADGTRFWAHVTITAIHDDDGELEGFAKITRDMTERREYEERLREERDFAERVLDTVPASVFVLDDSGDVVQTNERLREKLGMSEVEGELSVGDLEVFDEAGEPVSPEERPYREAFRTGEEIEDWQCQVELPSGERRWVSINVTPIADEDGRVERVVVAAQDVTHFRAQAERLERQRDELESELTEVFDRIEEAFFTVDEEWHITYVNDRVAELVRLPPEELLEARVWDVLPEVADGYPREMAEEAMATQEPVEFEFYSELLDIWVEIRAYPSEKSMSVYIRDITDRKERERALKENRERYRTLVENFPDGTVGLFDEDLEYTAIGGELLKQAELDPEDRVGYSIEELYPDELIDEVEPYFDAVFDGEANDFEVEYQDRHLAAQILPIRGADDEVAAGMLVVQDITEHKERERELEQYETIIESLNEGVYVVDADRNFQWVNEAYAELLGYSREELIGENASMIIDEEVLQEAEAIEQERGYGQISRMDVELIRKDGDRVPVDAASTLLPEGEKDGWFRAGVVRDITERKEYEQQLEELVAELEESNERLEQFAYAVSHDLQEPLRMISSYLQLIEDRYSDALDEEGDEFLEFAVDGADRMREMIDGLLAYSRVETRGDPFEAVDLNAVLEDVLKNLEVKIERTDAEITTEELPTVEGDANQLQQVFQNLLENAIEYSGDEPPRVHIAADREGEEWRLSVRDEGIGIDPDDADRIFDVFQRLHTRDEHAGTGIGLALCERIVERHGGEIWVDSEPGAGSTFSFTLPAERADG